MRFYHFLDETTYEHVSVVLAQGFSDLNFKNYGIVNYWEEYNSGYLIESSSQDNFGYICAIVSSQYLLKNRGKIDFMRKNFKRLVLLDSEDGGESTACTDMYPKFDNVFRCHFNSQIHRMPNVFPWQWGITNHMIRWIQQSKNYNIESKEHVNKMQINFRVPHYARLRGLKILQKNLPKDYQIVQHIDYINDNLDENLNKEQIHYVGLTQNRCLPGYVNRIKDNSLAFSFGGWFYDHESNVIAKHLNRAQIKFGLRIPKTASLVQFDSWRLWENYFSGVPVIHFDLDLYSAVLPVQPINGLHYLGIDIHGKINGINLRKWLQNSDKIAESGLRFANENYTPKEVARRFLNIMDIKAFS
jgi:hypothetical protein